MKKTIFAALITTGIAVQAAFALEMTSAPVVSDGVGKVIIDAIEMSFVMRERYDPNDEYDDDEPNFTSVKDISVYDDRGTFLSSVETLEKRCRSEPYPMNVDLDKFKKLKSDWLRNPATVVNYKKASKEFKSIKIRSTEKQTADDFEWQSICGDVNSYVMELSIFKHLPDGEWSKYEAKEPAWTSGEVSGTYPYVDQLKFTAFKSINVVALCSSAQKLNEDNWRLVRASRVKFTAGNANAKQEKDFEHYAALIDQAKQRIEWNQPRKTDITHLARMCTEYEAMVTNVNNNDAPGENLPMNRIAGLYLVGIALRDVHCSAGAAVVRNALEFARQNGKTEADVLAFAVTNNADQVRALDASVTASRIAGTIDDTLKLSCQVAAGSSRFLGLPNPQ